MAFNLVVGIIPAPGALAEIDKLEQGLDDASAAANRATQAVKTLGTETSKAAATLKDAGNAASAGIAEASSGMDAYRQKLNAQMDAQWAAINKTVLEGGTVPKAFHSYLSDEAKAMIDSLERVAAPVQRYEQELAALAIASKNGALSLEQYELALARVQKQAERGGALAPMQGPAFDPSKAGLIDSVNSPMQGPAFDPLRAGAGLTEELRREQQILEKINGPMREYQAQVAALDRLLQKGEVDLADYNRELERAGKAAGKGLNPVQGPQQQQQPGAGGVGGLGDSTSSLQSVLGGASALLAGGAAAGIVALGERIEGLIVQYRDIQDVAIKASNAVQRFTDSNHTATLVIDQQMELAAQLHSTYSQTIGLYGRLAESAEALSLSQGEITTLTKEFGEAVQVAGKPLESADGIMRRFAYGMAAGKIETREMRSIMREIPPIADLWTKAFGATRQQLIEMVKDGRVSTEDLMGALLKGGDSIQSKFEKLAETHAQTMERWIEDEKILSQRYDVGFGAGHGAQATVDALATAARGSEEGWRRVAEQAKLGGQLGELAAAALAKAHDQNKAAAADTISDLVNLSGAFRPIGDAYRKWVGDTAAVRVEVQKLNEPIAAAKTELGTLNKAFETGQIDVDTYNKRWAELQATINHGIGSQAFKILDPIRIARVELDRLNNEVEDGANVSQAQYRKVAEQLRTAIAGGVTPEDLKLNNPVLAAKDALADLNRAAKEGKITGEAFRREYDALITTVNDGRLPEAIKIWEGIHLPIDQAARDLTALSGLFRRGSLDVAEYTAELKKIADTHLNGSAAILGDGIARLDQRFNAGQLTLHGYDEAVKKLAASFEVLHRTSSGIAYRIAPEGPTAPAGLLPRTSPAGNAPSATDSAEMHKILEQFQSTTMIPEASENFRLLNDQFERAVKLGGEFEEPGAKYEQRIRSINEAVQLGFATEEQATAARRRARDTLNQETEALEAQKGPMEAYEAALRKLKDQIDAGDISQRKYAEGVDKAKLAMIDATGAARTFSGAMQIEWIKLQQEAESFGATVANLAIADFGKLNDAIVATANGGAVSWSQMADAMIQDLERVALKMLEIKLIESVVGLFGSGGGGGLADTSIGMEGWGGYPVGGSGGIGAAPVGLAASGEHLKITQPGAYPYPQPPSSGGAGAAAGGGATVVHVHNHYDSAISQAALDGPGGQASVMNTLRLKSGALRNLTSKPKRV